MENFLGVCLRQVSITEVKDDTFLFSNRQQISIPTSEGWEGGRRERMGEEAITLQKMTLSPFLVDNR